MERAVVTLEIERIKGPILDVYDDDDDDDDDDSIFFIELPRIFYLLFVIGDLVTFKAPAVVHTNDSED